MNGKGRVSAEGGINSESLRCFSLWTSSSFVRFLL
jgi:hypothetical protein